MIARLRTVPCDECSRPIRAWDGRIWLIEGERWAHSQCWKRRLFFERYMESMADEIRGQIKVNEFPPSPQSCFQPSDDASANHELRSAVTPATAPREPVDQLGARQQQAEELTARTRVEKNAKEERSSLMTNRPREKKFVQYQHNNPDFRQGRVPGIGKN
jgi:hypothetical protein